MNPDESTDRRSELSDPIARLARMMEIRAVEDAVQQMYNDGFIRGSTHLCNGQEAIAVGVAAETRIGDVLTCTYRGHGHALALGMTPTSVLAELCGRTTGCAGGVGGSMHLVDATTGLMPTFAIVGAGIPVATGAALAFKVRGIDHVAVAVFGDGATNIGAFHEALNFASVQNLPVVFVCENNLYGEYSPIARTTPVADLAVRATSYAMSAEVVDGQDIDQVRRSMAAAVTRARSQGGPTLLEMKTYRYSGHSRSDPATYRPAGELDDWLQRDPILIASDGLVTAGVIDRDGVDDLQRRVADNVQAAAAVATTAPEPQRAEMLAHITGA